MESTRTKALIIETTNLRGGGASEERRYASLERLLRHLSPQLSSLSEVVITGVEPRAEPRLSEAAARPIATLEETDYYRAKNLGFDATTAELVAFADSDCWPASDWVERLFEPFADPTVSAVAGRTTYRDDGFGRAA